MPENSRDWNERYATGETPWDTGVSSRELKRYLDDGMIKPCRALELGCGTGTNAVFLAQRGFDVTAVDISAHAIDRARARAAEAEVKVQFEKADILNLPDLGATFPFVFDRGVYHVIRTEDLEGFQKTLSHVTSPGSLYLVLAGNANDPAPADHGPPRVHGHEMCLELSPRFDLVMLREFRFDGVPAGENALNPLAWSGLWRRKAPQNL